MWNPFRRRATRRETSTVAARRQEVGGGAAVVTIPEGYETRVQADGTLLIYPPTSEAITIRVSVITFQPNEPRPLAGFELIRDQALESGYAFEEVNGKGVSRYEQVGVEDGEPLRLAFWNIGGNDEIAVISVSILKRCQDEAVVGATLSLIPRMLEQMEFPNRYEFIETGEGTVTARLTLTEPEETQTIHEIDRADTETIAADAAAGKGFVRKLLGDAGASEIDPKVLGRAFEQWLSIRSDEPSPDEVAEILGAAFGNYLVEALGVRWVRVTDKHGSALAVRHEVRQTMAFPIESVRKRIKDRQTGFFWNISRLIREQISRPEGL